LSIGINKLLVRLLTQDCIDVQIRVWNQGVIHACMIRRAGVLTGQFQSGPQQLLRPAFSPTIIGPRLKISKKRLELRQIFLIAIALKLGEMADST
jgi:hypothetical protein